MHVPTTSPHPTRLPEVLLSPSQRLCIGLGAVLSQEGTSSPTLVKHSKPVLHPIAYYSATFTPTERNYNIYERELLAVMQSLVHWRQYLG